MSDRLFKLLSESSHEIVQSILPRLRSSFASHEKQIDADLLIERTVLLVGAFIMSTQDDPIPFVVYAQGIAEDHISAGASLDEIQQGLNLLEDQVWRVVVARAPPEDQVDHLRQASHIIGLAKDQLVRVCLGQKARAEARIANLQLQLERLLKENDDSDPTETP